VVGKYDSLINKLADHFDLEDIKSENDVLDWIDQKHEQLKKEGKFWFIVVDEFGKHLEFAAKENPEQELYFVQLLSEYANEKDKNLYFITTLHQAFDSYANRLSLQQRKEWDKVRGRLKELTFNEPVEQLLYIASEYLDGKNKDYDNNNLKKLVQCIESSRAFPLRNDLELKLAKRLYPLDPLSAGILSLALQKYGQNERSLFTFLQSDEHLSINNYDHSTNPYYNLSCVYDYLIHNYHHFLSSKYNPHYVQWSALKKALERTESNFEKEAPPAKKLIKTIGLLNVFGSEGAIVTTEFLKEYATLALGLNNVEELISQLQEKKIIRYRAFKQQYILFEGTDLDIEYELQNVTSKVDAVTDVVTQLKKYFDFPYIPAKRVYYEKGTPRFFEFKLSEKPLNQSPKQPVDGYINLVFNEQGKEVIKASKEIKVPILYGVFKNTKDIEEQLFRIKKIKYLIEDIGDNDHVAKRELNELLNFQIEELNDTVLNNIYAGKGDIEWVYNGSRLAINNVKSLNNELTNISKEIYSKTPTFNNELINKEKVSPAIYRPRKKLLKALIGYPDKEDLGFDTDSFPAEKTIYLSLLQETGIHKKEDGKWRLGAPREESGFEELWNASETFFESTKSGKRKITDFIGLLEKPPFGLKAGLIELWVPIYLIIKKDDFALFKEEAYVTELTYEMANLVFRNPKLFEIKAFHISDIKKKIFAKYRSLLDQEESVAFSNESFVETIRPFLLIYNDLNDYSRNTTKISAPAQKLRGAIKSATDPERAFFEQFITALGYTNLAELESDKAIQQFVYDLDKSIDEIKKAYSKLIDRIEECLLDTLHLENKTYDKYKEIITSRYKSISNYKLVDYQKKLLGRLLSDQPSREKWIEAVAFAILDKPLTSLEDEEEPMLLDRLATRIEELDNLRELSTLNVDPDKDEAFKLKVQPFSKKAIDLNVIVDKSALEKESKRFEQLKELLSDNKELNLALLLKLIEDLENHE
jgi:hypothetical protein